MAIQKGPSGSLGTTIEAGEITNGTITPAKLSTGAPTWDTSSNVGIGTTPSSSNLATIQSPYALLVGNNQTNIICNGYYNSGFKYVGTGAASHYRQLNGGHEWYTATSGTAGNAISFTQTLNLSSNGSLALQGASTSANGVGITFPATQSASSNANTLDDYEEGTWSPVISPGTSGSYTGYFRQFGYYTKVGNAVTISTYVTIGSGGANSPTGSYIYTSLPFSVAATSGSASVTILSNSTVKASYFVTGTNILIIFLDASTLSWGGIHNDIMVSATYISAT